MFINLIVFYLLLYYINSYITIPFKKEFFKENKTIFDELLSNNLKILIKIGKPIQKIPFYLNLTEYGFFINSNYFKINNSKTYKKLNVDEYEEIYDFIDGLNDISYSKKKDKIESSDQIIIGKENIYLKNISFLIHNQTNNNNYGILGLNQYYDHNYYKNYNIIYQLKEKNSIKSYSFFIEYKNYNEGKLIIGANPHEIYKNYDNEYFNIFKNINIEGGYKINFYKIYFNNNTMINNLNAELSFENGMIRGTNIYRNLIEKNFFEKFIEQNLCFKIKNYLNDYEYNIFYYCEKNVIENFPTLIFQIYDTKFEFKFDKNDLFYNINDKSYFLIYFKNIDMGKWILGKPFFKKYLITFNHDKKTISYYTQFKNNIEFKFKFTYLSLIINVILVILIIFLFYYLYYYFKYKIRKIRANELIENDNYNYNLNINQQYIEL